MAKYSYDLKKQVVDAYFCGEGGYTFLAEKYGIKIGNKFLIGFITMNSLEMMDEKTIS